MKNIPIPLRLQSFPLYRGMLVHFTVFVNDDSVPDFRIVHEENRRKCMKDGLCALCGQELEVLLVFFGGPLCERNRYFIDGPMHEDCARYAIQVCPYLAMSTWEHSTRELPKPPEGTAIRDLDMVQNSRPRMAMFYTDGYKIISYQGNLLYAAEPFSKVDWDAMPQPEQAK